nr:class I SAM-dependent methyltransferase [Halobiforma nitratireducens]
MADYLEAKRSVDDRALNRRVLERFSAELADREEPVRLLEIGAGVGTMIGRLAERDLLPDRVSYRAVDRNGDGIARARDRVPAWLEAAGYDVEVRESGESECYAGTADTASTATTIVAQPSDGRTDGRLEIDLEIADAFDIDEAADAVIASAVLDLFDPEDALPAIDELLADGGLLYAPITFDGATGFEPRDSRDERVEQLYHQHMDEIRDGGTSRAGRALLGQLPERGWTVLESGGSDWIVRPNAAGENEGKNDGHAAYPGMEAIVVSHVLETMADALAAFPDALEPDERRAWIERRRRELADGELVFVAHNLDVLARAPGD